MGPDPCKSSLAFGQDPDLHSRSVFILGHRSKKKKKKTGAFSFFPPFSFKFEAGGSRGMDSTQVLLFLCVPKIYSPSCRGGICLPLTKKLRSQKVRRDGWGGNTSAPGVGWRVSGVRGSQTHPSGLHDLPRLMKSVLTRTSSLSLRLHSLSSHL